MLALFCKHVVRELITWAGRNDSHGTPVPLPISLLATFHGSVRLGHLCVVNHIKKLPYKKLPSNILR